MSNSTKRLASEAFGQGTGRQSSRNKRARKDAKSQQSRSSDADRLHHHKKMAIEPSERTAEQPENSQESEKSQKQYTSVSHQSRPNLKPQERPSSLKLEDRITLPKAVHIASQTGESTQNVSIANQRGKSRRNSRTANGKHSSEEAKTFNTWHLSPPTAGMFIDHDPIITTDGKYLILPTKTHVQVYSTSTSLLVRSIATKEKESISACSISITNPSTLLVVTRKGTFMKYDIQTGYKIDRWALGSKVTSIIPIGGDVSSECVLTMKSRNAKDDELILVSLTTGGKFESVSLLHDHQLLPFLSKTQDSSIIVACSSTSIHIGKRGNGDSFRYSWYQLTVPGTIRALDVHMRQTSSKSNKHLLSTDVVVGLENGALLIYEDILARVSKRTGNSNQNNEGRRLHWHRGQVRSVKWSKDGNYIISGGDESVLVIWQLETNQQQFLPHLTSSILNIIVSSSGAHYGIRLGDNSVMILSTADLLPTTNVAGICLQTDRNDWSPMQMHPTKQNILLAAMSARPLGRESDSATNNLQTYDIDNHVQLSRQALTRNINTVVNVAPDGKRLKEPDVTHLQLNYDGTWMATVDKWSPGLADVQALYIKEDDDLDKQKYVELVLRFWSWNSEDNTWAIGTRVDEPHTGDTSSILALASHPTNTEFASMGDDGIIKFWKPKRRVRDGVQVRDKDGRPLFTWTCSHTVQVEYQTSKQATGVLSYSEDGSIIVASWSQKQRHVHIIDSQSGKICMSIPRLISEGPASIAIMGRNLLCLSSSLEIFDMVILQITFSIRMTRNHSSFLAVNSYLNTFVVGFNPQDNSQQAVITAFDIDNPDQGPVSEISLTGQIRAVLAEASTSGFVVIDNNSCIRKLVPPGRSSLTLTSIGQQSPTIEDNTTKGLDGIFGQGVPDVHSEATQSIAEGYGTSQQDLASLFTTNSTSAQVSVGELFERVSKVIAGNALVVSA